MQNDALWAILAVLLIAAILLGAGWVYRRRNSSGSAGTGVSGDTRGRDDHPDADLR